MTDLWILAVLAVFATGMSVTTAITIKWAAFARSGLRAAVVVFLLLMMTGMLLGAAIYFYDPSTTSLVIGLWVAAALMSAAVVVVFLQFLREAFASSSSSPHSPAALEHVMEFQFVVILTVVANELLMGWTFQRAAGGPVILGNGTAGDFLGQLLVSPWFVLPMAVEMACALAWLRSEFPRPMIGLLAIQPILMLASPPSIGASAWVIATAVISSVAMAAALAVVLLDLFHGRAVPRRILRYATALYVSLGLMAGGLAVWALTGAVELYALAVACQMIIFLFAVTAPARFRAGQPEELDGTEGSDTVRTGAPEDPVPFALGDGPRLRSP